MNIYQNKIQEYETTISKLDKLLNRLSILRLAVFIFSLTLIMILANGRYVTLISIAAPICLLGFAILIKRYNQLSYEKKHFIFLKEINESEILRLENKLSDLPTGYSFIHRDHAYNSDLDIFGTHSLFQLINRTTTESGHSLLAKWLSEPASKEIIYERQRAVQELSPKLNWRQDFQASGMHFQNLKTRTEQLLSWVQKPVRILPHKTKYLAGSILLSISSTAAAFYFVYGFIYSIETFSLKYSLPLITILIVNSLVLRRTRPISDEIINNAQNDLKTLGSYQSLIKKVELDKFDSEILLRLQSIFLRDKYSAADEIKQLKNLFELFQIKGTKRSIGRNEIYTILNRFWLFDIYLIILVEKWKNKNRDNLQYWSSAISEFEVLSSLAGFAYSNPSFAFPKIEEEPYIIDFENLGHPLIHEKKRVSNNFKMEGRGEIAMITGSNMAGKSTFLRTVGINLVLALMGAPCCAKSGRVSQMIIFTSMRTQDNLEEGVSSFYAELKRIEQLLTLIESGQIIFFLLDEMFKGTNSQDRYKGGASLIRQLSDLNAFGIISTHDLELARLVAKQVTVTNFSFNSVIKQNEIIFNYSLTNGICTDFNASELMRRSGIKILPDLKETG